MTEIHTIELAVCSNCNKDLSNEIMIGFCPGCNTHNLKIRYEHLLVYKAPFTFDGFGNLRVTTETF